MKLRDLIFNIDSLSCPQNFLDEDIMNIVMDSRQAQEGSLFVSLQGGQADGNLFIKDAIDRGVKGIIVKSGTIIPESGQEAVCLEHRDPKSILPDLLNQFYNDPSSKLSLIGVTGTNGKTTITYLIESIYREAGKQCGVIGTVNYRFAGKAFSAKNTTPGVTDNFYYLSQMLMENVDACVMEVSSHALVQGRVKGLCFHEAIFTNLTSDHLDYHKTQEEYFQAKALFFDGSIDVRRALVNADDLFGKRLKQMCQAPVLTYGLDPQGDIYAGGIQLSPEGSKFILNARGEKLTIQTSLIGKHNIYNILAAAGACLDVGFSLEQIKSGIETLSMVPGRLQRVEEAKEFCVFVDYAHTEDALKNVLESIKETNPSRILVVFGCGGDRDKTKRPKMAAVVEQFSDWAVVTNDNPRAEDPQAIVDDILQGFRKDNYEVILNRENAISKLLELAKPGDCILIAGKGHEDYQIFKDQTIHFDDREIVKKYLKG